jgi:hypothetical protein
MEPAAIRYKNPGAMWPGAVATKWGSTKWIYLSDGTGQGGGGHGNKIAIFDTWVQGICAQLDLWRTSPKYRGKRFADAIAVWSGGNHVESYIAYVCARVPGMTRDTIMDDAFWRSPMGIAFLKAQSGHEAGKPIPAPEGDWVKAQQIVMRGGAPPVFLPPPAPKPRTAVVVATTVTTGTVVAANQAASSGLSGPSIAFIIAVGLILAGVGVWWFHFRRKE